MTIGRGRSWAPQEPKPPSPDELKQAREMRETGQPVRIEQGRAR